MIREEPANRDKRERLKYPTLNVYTSPRYAQQKIDHKSIPLCIYTGPIEANNVSKYYDQKNPSFNDLRRIDQPDGLIHQFSLMNEKPRDQQERPLGIKILVCICMYNESKNAINLTLGGIYNNLVHLEEQGFSQEQIGVVLIQDGILKLVADRKTKTLAKGANSMVEFYRELDRLDGKPRCDLEERINIILEEIENFNKKGMSAQVANNRDFPPTIEKNVSLLYQNLWDPGMTDPERKLEAQLKGETFDRKLKIFSCFKHLNGTKLSSHLWFFEGFCRYLQPQFIVLLDVGTQPNQNGVVNLIKGFYNRDGTQDFDVGGTTGLMSVDSNFPSEEGGAGVRQQEEGWFSKAFFSIEKAQEYQYVISHFIDKNAQSALGFLHVLPGAWSAYRYKALIKSDDFEPNLLEHSYFKITLNPDLGLSGYQEANMYLAEDRILSLGIYCQPKSQFYLRYIPDAGARTDPMKSHQDLMKQRRRWINSSLFAFLYVFKNYYFNSGESNHNPWDRYFKLNMSMFIALLSFATSYFIPSLYFYVLYALIIQIDVNSGVVEILAKIASLIYVITYLIGIAGGLSGAVWTKYAQNLSRVFAAMNYFVLGLVGYNIINIYLGFTDPNATIDWTDFTQISVIIMLAINIGGYLLVIFMHLPTHPGQVWRLICDICSYWYYQGAYSQTLVAHAFCNVDDVSWGTKGSTSKHGQKGYDTDKVFFVSNWVFWNCILAYVCIYVDVVITQGSLGPNGNRKKVILAIAIFGSAQLLIKIILAFYHHIYYHVICCKQPLEVERLRKVQDFWNKQNGEWREKVQDIALQMQNQPVSRINKRIQERRK